MERFDKNTGYDVVDVQGKPFLFVGWRVDRKTIPDNLYVYEIADGDGDGCFARIQNHVWADFWGTIIGKYALELDEGLGGYYPPFGSAEYEGLYLDHEMTLEKYLSADPDELIPDKNYGRTIRDGEYAIMKSHEYTVKLNFEETSIDRYGEDEFKEQLYDALAFYMEITGLEFEYNGSKICCNLRFTAKATESLQCIVDNINDVAEECGLTAPGSWPDFIPVRDKGVA